MKKLFAILLSLVLALLSVAALAETAEPVELAEPEFDPIAEEPYTIYTVVEYTIEDIQADLVCTVSANEEKTEFFMECNFYGDDQAIHAVLNENADLENNLAEAFTLDQDKTGFMKGDTPAIFKIAMEQDVWLPIEAK